MAADSEAGDWMRDVAFVKEGFYRCGHFRVWGGREGRMAVMEMRKNWEIRNTCTLCLKENFY